MTVLPEQPYEHERAATLGTSGRTVAQPVVLGLGAVTVACILAGVFVRAFHVLSFDFPLNDGGLFFAMTRDLQDANYRLPSVTSYNGGDIPFAYPPFGFYVAALVDHLTPLSLIDVFRFLPWLATSLTLPAFYLLARSLLRSQAAVVASVFAFAVIPRGYIWLLMGGGVTRSLGFLFAVLALYFIHRMYKGAKPSNVALAALCCGLTALNHLETAWFLAFSAVLFYVVFGRTRRALVSSLVVAAGTVLVSAPWWASVLAEHGTEPFLAAAGTGGTVFSGGEGSRGAFLGLTRFVSTSEPLFPFIGTLAVFGALVSVVSRRYFLTVWWAAIVLLEVRGFPTYTTVPVAMLAGIGITEVLLPLLFRKQGDEGLSVQPASWTTLGRITPATALPMLILAGLVVYTSAGALLRDRVFAAEGVVLESISADDRAGLAWVNRLVPEGSSFLVVPDTPFWEVSKITEWFPALTEHISVATVQGSEWLDEDGFQRARAIHQAAFECGNGTVACLQELEDTYSLQFAYVYIRQAGATPCCATLIRSLENTPDYQLLYRGKGAVVFARASEEGPASASDPD
jgi:hypothetical protein